MVDSVLLVVRAGHTSKELVLEAVESVGREKILGVIFNATDDRPKNYAYHYRNYDKRRG